jgi:hypothetical protein
MLQTRRKFQSRAKSSYLNASEPSAAFPSDEYEGSGSTLSRRPVWTVSATASARLRPPERSRLGSSWLMGGSCSMFVFVVSQK